jgi:hypothetical protein
MSEDKRKQAALIAKYWDGKLPVVIFDIVQNVINIYYVFMSYYKLSNL